MTSFSVTNQAKRSVWQNTNVPVLGTWESSKKKLKLTDIFRFWKKNTDFTITQVSYAMAEEGTKPSAPLWIEVLHQSKALQTISDHFWCLTLPGFSACSGCHCFVKPETLASNFYPGKNTFNFKVFELFWAIQFMPLPFITDTQNTIFSFQISLPSWNHTEVRQKPPYSWR